MTTTLEQNMTMTIEESMLHRHGNIEMDTIRGYVTNSLKYTGHVSDTTRLHDRSVNAT